MVGSVAAYCSCTLHTASPQRATLGCKLGALHPVFRALLLGRGCVHDGNAGDPFCCFSSGVRGISCLLGVKGVWRPCLLARGAEWGSSA
jgi:hypothetical protein